MTSERELEALAHELGAKGSPANEPDRLAFEAWMRGHCWALSATWIDGGYLGDRESKGRYCADAARTRMLWAAWRDRGELARRLQPARVSHTDASVDAMQSKMADLGFVVPVRVISEGMLAAIAAAPAAEGGQPEPIRMVLHCPRCHVQHIDEPDERTPGWNNPPHRSHLCHACGCIWRPADVPTMGVASTETRGKADTWSPAHPAPESREADEEKCNAPNDGRTRYPECDCESKAMCEYEPEAGQREGVEEIAMRCGARLDRSRGAYTLTGEQLRAVARRLAAQPILSRDAGDVSNDSAQQAGIAWEATSGYLKRYVTDEQYRKFRPAIREWYKPYRCSNCTQRTDSRGEGE